MHAGNGGNGQNQTAFPFIADADAAERSARAEFLAALTTYFERVKRRLKEPPPHPLVAMSPDALRAFAFLQEGVMIEKEVRLGPEGHPLVVARADLLRADLRRRMAADVAASAPPPEWATPSQPLAAAEVNGGSSPSSAVTASTTPAAQPSAMSGSVPSSLPVHPGSRAPLFSEALAEYLALREGAGEDRRRSRPRACAPRSSWP